MTQSTVSLTGVPLTGAFNAKEIATIHVDFPYLKRTAHNGKALVCLDWAAASRKPAGITVTGAGFYHISNGAAGRSTYQLVNEAIATFEDACDAVAAFIGARNSGLVFTENVTGAINLVTLVIGHTSQGRLVTRNGEPAAADDPA